MAGIRSANSSHLSCISSSLYYILILYTIYMEYIDIHSHLSFKDYGPELLGVLINMRANNTATISVGGDYESSKESVRLAQENPDIFACVGCHPEGDLDQNFDVAKYEELVKMPKVVAIGECGLDYFRLADKTSNKNITSSDCHSRAGGNPGLLNSLDPNNEDWIPACAGMTEGDLMKREISRQKEVFWAHISLAKKYNKPLMIHVRDAVKNTLYPQGQAYNDVLAMLEGQGVKGNIHFFAGNWEVAQKFLAIGFTLSFTGVITFAHSYDEVIKKTPLNMIMAETDAPYVAPVPYRGQRNEPAYVHKVVEKIAEIRGEDILWVKHQLLENSKKYFSIQI